MTVSVRQDAPGVYSGVAKGLAQGVYQVSIEQRLPDTGELIARQGEGFVVPYPGEFSITDNAEQAGRELLGDLAQLGGGAVLTLADPREVLAHDLEAQPVRLALWPWLLLASILLFPLDVATRRLSVSWSDLFRRGRDHQDAKGRP